jgi:hypothetical protein
MDFQTAIKTLELNAGFSLVDVKRNYYKLSLKWHPDKNTSINSTKKFQEIAEAYEFLKIYLDLENGNETNETNETNESNETNENDFLNMCNHFLSSLIETTKTMTGNRITNEQIMNILKQLTTKCEKVSIKLFEGIDKESSILLFNYLVSYADILSISQETLNEIKNVIELKMKNDNIIILNPNIENLLNDEVYVLNFEDKTYYIPLWHNELIYDTAKGKLIVKIEPELPPHLEIDDNNNIIVNLTTKINSLLVNEKLIFKLGEKVFQMTSENLRIKKKQQFFLKNKGLTRINYSELYNIKKKADIIVNLELVE